jgi:4-alpha-glucanotransferase
MIPMHDAPHPLLARRSAGILLHLSSLPGPHGIGDLGPSAHRFVRWLAAAGQRFWQMLPIGPVGAGDSPYSALSAFAGEPRFVALAPLVAERLLPRGALAAPAALGRGRSDYDAAMRFKRPRLLAAFLEFVANGLDRSAEYRRFLARTEAWLPGWCDFAAEREGGAPEYHAFVQFLFDRQWAALRAAAAARGVRLIGDVPIFVGGDGADVAGRPELFRLDRSGRPEVLTGVPPDSFSATGQLWGQPHYRWVAHRREGFRWWIGRFRRAAELFDLVRIDHFIGFRQAYEVPGGAKDARRGRWVRSPGEELLVAVRDALGGLPLIAEDLGAVTPEVHALRDRFGLPGMRIVQNAFYGDDSPDLPCLHPEHAVAYPGTHDNDTITGWWRRLPAAARRRFRAYVGGDAARSATAVAEAMLRITLQSPARLAVVQLQDALGLPPSTRMNVPAVPTGNWTWRANAAILTASAARRLRGVARVAARVVDAASQD